MDDEDVEIKAELREMNAIMYVGHLRGYSLWEKICVIW